MSLDPLDQTIIRQLQRDGRTPYEDIAAAAGVPVQVVAQRTGELRETGAVDVVAVTDPLQLGFAKQAMLGIELTDPDDPDDAQAVAASLTEMRDVIYLVRSSGGIDFFCEVVGASDARLLELVAQIRRVPGVRRIQPFLCQEVVKETYAFGTA